MTPSKIAFDRLDSSYVLVIGPASPRDAEWTEWVEFITVNSTPGMKPRILVVTDGGAPSAAQRAALNDVTEQYKSEVKVAVVTESTMARGALTALSWFAANVYRPFSPAEVDKALQYLDLPPSKGSEIKGMVRVMQRKLGLTVLKDTRAG